MPRRGHVYTEEIEDERLKDEIFHYSNMKFYKNKKFYLFIGLGLILSLLLFFIILVILTATVKKPSINTCFRNNSRSFKVDNETIQRFQKSLSFQTISLENREEFDKMRNFIERAYPLIHGSSKINRTIHNQSLVYEIHGEDPSLMPYLLIGHLDVVPVNYDKWDHPPFNGTIVDGYIYGRGTLDAKYIVMGILEALEQLLEDKISFQRGFYLVFGHDEESLGLYGAKEIARNFQNKGTTFEFILDEGTFVMPDVIPGISNTPVALVSVTEKGYLTLNLSVETEPGHSSMPLDESAPVILAEALSKLKGDCHPNKFGDGPETLMFTQIAPYVSFLYKMIFSNLWLFSGLLGKILSKNPRSNALARTTTAVTLIHSGVKENILPSSAWAIVNHRTHPSQKNSDVVKVTKEIVNDDRIKIEIAKSVESPKTSPTTDSSFGYQMIRRAVAQIHEDSVTVPSVLIASTDSKWFNNMAKGIYRFSPATVLAKELAGIHGNNEKLRIDSYQNAIKFYYHLMKEADNENLIC